MYTSLRKQPSFFAFGQSGLFSQAYYTWGDDSNNCLHEKTHAERKTIFGIGLLKNDTTSNYLFYDLNLIQD